MRLAISGVIALFVLACGAERVPGGAGGASPGAPHDGGVPADSQANGPADGGTSADAATSSMMDAPNDSPTTLDAAPDVSVGPEAGRDASIDASEASACSVDCSHLPNLRPGVSVSCVGGRCLVPAGSCLDGFANCSGNPNDGCEADLSRPQTCGSCFIVCSGVAPLCVSRVSGSRSTYSCSASCSPPRPDSCGTLCVDLASDRLNCGTCGKSCFFDHAVGACQAGSCVVASCQSGFADCTPEPDCETQLGTADNCGACGDRACSLAHTLLACTSASNCSKAVCEAGFANCDTASADCETAFESGGTCLPAYAATVPLATSAFNDPAAIAIGSDGSYFIAGQFTGIVDFDPTSGMDIRTAPMDDADTFITKFDARGNYAWTRTFVGRGDSHLRHLAAASGGAVIAVGDYTDTIDLDPGAAVALHQTAAIGNEDLLVVKLAADGSFVWGDTLGGLAQGNSVSVDAADAVYVAGSFQGDIDVDPGPAADIRSALVAGLLVKLNSSGTLAWARVVDDGGCSITLNTVDVASDGSAWVAGAFTTGCDIGRPVDGGFPESRGNDAIVLGFSPAGDARGTWTFGGDQDDAAYAIAAGRGNGTIYVAGEAGQGPVDFDPGPGVATRIFPDFGGFVLNLGADGSFRWVHAMPSISIFSLAATSDGGVLAAGGSFSPFVTRLSADGGSGWTFAPGSVNTVVQSVAAGATTFAIAGIHSGSADFNPGAGMDIIFGEVTYFSRFGF